MAEDVHRDLAKTLVDTATEMHMPHAEVLTLLPYVNKGSKCGQAKVEIVY